MSEGTGWRIRPGTPDDAPSYRHFLYMAACWEPGRAHPPIEAVLAEPRNSRYVAGWGRDGDAAVVALDKGERPIGAAWYRLFPADEPGYGFVDATTPELSLAVEPDWRGRGVGAALLSALLERARADGYAALSLSVASANPAMRLYERAGFQRVALSGGSWTMRAACDRPPACVYCVAKAPREGL